MFSRSNHHHQQRQRGNSPRPVKDTQCPPSRNTTQPSARIILENQGVNRDHMQHNKPTSSHTIQRLPSPPKMPGPSIPRPTSAHSHHATCLLSNPTQTGEQAVPDDVSLLESLLELALAELVAIRSTSDTPSTLSQLIHSLSWNQMFLGME